MTRADNENGFLIGILEEIGGHLIFFGKTVKWMFKPPFDGKNIIAQMLEIGYRSVPVTAITLFFTGMVMALQLGRAMDMLMAGSSIFIGSAVSIAMLRELCPVLTALLLAGRVGSAIAAEIGSMKVTEQIDALVTLRANPIQYLSVPRFIACLVMTPASPSSRTSSAFWAGRSLLFSRSTSPSTNTWRTYSSTCLSWIFLRASSSPSSSESSSR